MRTLCLILMAATLAACGSSPEPGPAQPDKAAQQQEIREIFQKAAALPDRAYEDLERLYLQAIECCPDTSRVHEAYRLLYNLYMYGYGATHTIPAQQLCEEYLVRYQGRKAPMRLEMQNHLLSLYDQLYEYAKLAALYDQLFARGYDAFPLSQPAAHAYSYAQALEKTERFRDAQIWYHQALLHSTPGDFLHGLAEEALARLDT